MKTLRFMLLLLLLPGAIACQGRMAETPDRIPLSLTDNEMSALSIALANSGPEGVELLTSNLARLNEQDFGRRNQLLRLSRKIVPLVDTPEALDALLPAASHILALPVPAIQDDILLEGAIGNKYGAVHVLGAITKTPYLEGTPERDRAQTMLLEQVRDGKLYTVRREAAMALLRSGTPETELRKYFNDRQWGPIAATLKGPEKLPSALRSKPLSGKDDATKIKPAERLRGWMSHFDVPLDDTLNVLTYDKNDKNLRQGLPEAQLDRRPTLSWGSGALLSFHFSSGEKDSCFIRPPQDNLRIRFHTSAGIHEKSLELNPHVSLWAVDEDPCIVELPNEALDLNKLTTADAASLMLDGALDPEQWEFLGVRFRFTTSSNKANRKRWATMLPNSQTPPPLAYGTKYAVAQKIDFSTIRNKQNRYELKPRQIQIEVRLRNRRNGIEMHLYKPVRSGLIDRQIAAIVERNRRWLDRGIFLDVRYSNGDSDLCSMNLSGEARQGRYHYSFNDRSQPGRVDIDIWGWARIGHSCRLGQYLPRGVRGPQRLTTEDAVSFGLHPVDEEWEMHGVRFRYTSSSNSANRKIWYDLLETTPFETNTDYPLRRAVDLGAIWRDGYPYPRKVELEMKLVHSDTGFVLKLYQELESFYADQLRDQIESDEYIAELEARRTDCDIFMNVEEDDGYPSSTMNALFLLPPPFGPFQHYGWEDADDIFDNRGDFGRLLNAMTFVVTHSPDCTDEERSSQADFICNPYLWVYDYIDSVGYAASCDETFSARALGEEGQKVLFSAGGIYKTTASTRANILIHEARHHEPSDPGHVTCTNPDSGKFGWKRGCDEHYVRSGKLDKIGAYNADSFYNLWVRLKSSTPLTETEYENLCNRYNNSLDNSFNSGTENAQRCEPR
jgi:hypothetical protein